MEIAIDLVARRPELAETVARWHWREWGHLTPTLSLEARVDGIREQAAATYVAIAGGEAVGTAGLVEHDMETHPELGPWIAGVYVDPAHRRRGVAAALTEHVAGVAASRGAATLYLYTDAAQAYWERLGWYRIADELYLGEVVSIMGLDVGPGGLHDELVARLRYFDGHSDTLGLFVDGGFLARAARALAAPFRDASVQKVAGIEARGFVLATAVALELGAGLVAIRKPGSIHPGPKAELAGPPDWRGIETVLRLQRHVVAPGDRVLVVDDWAETGSKATTARRLVEECGGRYVGLSLLVDQLPTDLREALAPVAAVALASQLKA